MTPAARVQAAIEVLDSVVTGVAAEKALTNWARRARYAGSKDRRAVRDHVFQALRCRRSYAALGSATDGRGLMLGAIRSSDHDPNEIFSGIGHAPAPLSPDEVSRTKAVQDEWADWNLPDWMLPEFRKSLGDQAFDTALSLCQRAPVMLRVNLRKLSVSQAKAALAKEGIETRTDEIAATALRVTEGAPRVQQSQTYQQGLVELQDGSSQAAMETVRIPEGARVLDFCAGGGGKTLALAARVQAHWFAHDLHASRMRDIPERSDRAGVTVTCVDHDALQTGGLFDVVLCDVPCSGSGTWRRAPQAKWNLTPQSLEDLTQTQAQILCEGAALTAPRGQLIYATCSLFEQENERQISRFLDQNSNWKCTFQKTWTVSDVGDGFFVAHLTGVDAGGRSTLTR